jgi:ribonuclease VapC
LIAVDASALVAIVLDELPADACKAALRADEDRIISAATLAEALIVAGRRGVRDRMERLVEGLELQVALVDAASARRAADAYLRWGKGFHAAALNFGDCFAYELAKSHGCALLYVGDDFARTDVASAL